MSVFLSNVDDYLGPSQACVNPLFQGSAETSPQNPPQSSGRVQTRQRRRLRAGLTSNTDTTDTTTSINNNTATPSNSTVSASIADCLACAGCVTTAETVLLEEQHSLDKLRQAIHQLQQQQQEKLPSKDDTRIRLVATVSPASWADLCRHVGSDDTAVARGNSQQPQLQQQQQLQHQLATMLHTTLQFSTILDGNLALDWSRQAAASDFVQQYRQEHPQNGPTENATTSTIHQLSSSCPAAVCYAETQFHAGVPHLSPIKSSMALAGAYFATHDTDTDAAGESHHHKRLFHVAIMPCHDKKLEASRTELADDAVDLSITTAECWQLLQEFGNMEEDGQRPLVPVRHTLEGYDPTRDGPCWITPAPATTNSTVSSTVSSTGLSADTFHVDSSGGYADFLFRHACRELFGYIVNDDTLVWRPYSSSSLPKRRVVSARVARQQRRREYYHATLYRVVHAPTPRYALEEKPNDDCTYQLVLHFGIANGMQTLPTALEQHEQFHYLEVMACPSGCLNGGGQIRRANRETPADTRQRLAASREWYATNKERHTIANDNPIAPDRQRTTYRQIAPLQHSLGAAAGVEVRHTQW